MTSDLQKDLWIADVCLKERLHDPESQGSGLLKFTSQKATVKELRSCGEEVGNPKPFSGQKTRWWFRICLSC